MNEIAWSTLASSYQLIEQYICNQLLIGTHQRSWLIEHWTFKWLEFLLAIANSCNLGKNIRIHAKFDLVFSAENYDRSAVEMREKYSNCTTDFSVVT